MPSPTDKVWYFSFGSNMSPKILTNVRKVKPTQSLPSFLPGWYLNFNTMGLPYWEPSYASIGQTKMSPDQPEVHGVVHEITRADYDQIKRTELAGEHEDIGYATVEVTVHTYDGQKLNAITLIEVQSKVWHGQFYPSKRYMELLEHGSVEFGLKPSYTQWLKTLPRFDVSTIQSNRHRLGKLLFLTVLVNILIVPIWGPIWIGTYIPQFRAPRWSIVLQKFTISLLGHLYYFIFLPIFGPGAGEQTHASKSKSS